MEVSTCTNHILGQVKGTYMKLEIQLASVVTHYFSRQARVKLPATNDLYQEQKFSTVQMKELKKTPKQHLYSKGLFQEVILELVLVKASLPRTSSMLRIFRKVFSSTL